MDIEKRREEGLRRIRKTIADRRKAGLPAIPPKERGPFKANKVPPGQQGAKVRTVRVDEVLDDE